MSKSMSTVANASWMGGIRRFVMLVLPFLSLCIGCVHQPIQTKARYSLERASEYSLLVPSVLPQTIDGDFQTSQIALSGKVEKAPNSRQCSIKGSIFSLNPGVSWTSDQWLVTSPSVQGWEKHGGEIDLTAEWDGFTHALLLRRALGCFPQKESLSSITRAIVEKIPLPASESLLFFYSFSGNRGFVDLAPGMQIKIEQTLLGEQNRKQFAQDNPRSLEAQYEVVPLPTTGVTLHLSKTASRQSERSIIAKESLLFTLSVRFATKPLLRVFLETVMGNDTKRSPILIGADNQSDLDAATRQIEGNSDGECPVLSTAVNCVSFSKETAVSLLSPIWINGRLSYRPIGTTVGYMIDILPTVEKAKALETISMRRPLAMGGYAEVTFPKTLESVGQVILLSGDRLTWKH
jgi:hypothetical protein